MVRALELEVFRFRSPFWNVDEIPTELGKLSVSARHCLGEDVGVLVFGLNLVRHEQLEQERLACIVLPGVPASACLLPLDASTQPRCLRPTVRNDLFKGISITI